MPHVITSTILFTLLSALSVIAHFRPGKGDEFNLTNIAAVLHESQIPKVAELAKAEILPQGGRRRWVERNVSKELVDKLGERKIFLTKRQSDTDMLEISQF